MKFWFGIKSPSLVSVWAPSACPPAPDTFACPRWFDPRCGLVPQIFACSARTLFGSADVLDVFGGPWWFVHALFETPSWTCSVETGLFWFTPDSPHPWVPVFSSCDWLCPPWPVVVHAVYLSASLWLQIFCSFASSFGFVPSTFSFVTPWLFLDNITWMLKM